MAKNTDPVKKKNKTSTKKKMTNGTKKKKATSTAAQRNAIKRKKYLDKAYKSGIDTTDVRTNSRGVTRIQQTGASKTQRKDRNKPTIRGHYKNTKGGTTRLERTSAQFRQVSRGYKAEKTKSESTAKKKMTTKRKKK